MNNDQIARFGATVAGHYNANDDHEILGDTLEMGDVDSRGNEHPQHDMYEMQIEQQGDAVLVNRDLNETKPF